MFVYIWLECAGLIFVAAWFQTKLFISSNLPGAYVLHIAQYDHTHGTPCFDAAANMKHVVVWLEQ